jgi:transposase
MDGTWEKILDGLRADCDEGEGKDWTVSVESTVVRAHQHAAGARRALPAERVTGRPPNDKNPPGREALGRSRGGLSTKIHLMADRRCRPLTDILTPGQHGDCPQFIPLMGQVRIGRRGRDGPAPGPAPRWATRPIPPPPTAPTCARAASRQSSRSRKTRRNTAATGAARAPALDREGYKDRNTVERCFAKLKQFRAVPPDSTSASSCARAPSTSPQSGSGSEILSHDPRDRI